MQVAFCKNCGKHTGHKRSIGAGTVLGALYTSGLSLLAIPAYGKRCVVCGLTETEARGVTSARAVSRTYNRDVTPASETLTHIFAPIFRDTRLAFKGICWVVGRAIRAVRNLVKGA
jgi:hypothetical protein